MKLVIAVLLLHLMNRICHGFPVNNGYTMKFYPISAKEDFKSRRFGGIFAKIPQEPPLDAKLTREIFSEAHFPDIFELGLGCTNQIARVIHTFKSCNHNNSESREGGNYINLPLVEQPFQRYKILVALAPPALKISNNDNKPLIIYVVFSEDDKKKLHSINIPSVYFVNNMKSKVGSGENTRVDPILIIDSNRTVTGLRSKEISKYIKFRNKFINLSHKRHIPGIKE